VAVAPLVLGVERRIFVNLLVLEVRGELVLVVFDGLRGVAWRRRRR
jgi:hypothetical protein